jgi:hypothetical protein
MVASSSLTVVVVLLAAALGVQRPWHVACRPSSRQWYITHQAAAAT